MLGGRRSVGQPETAANQPPPAPSTSGELSHRRAARGTGWAAVAASARPDPDSRESPNACSVLRRSRPPLPDHGVARAGPRCPSTWQTQSRRRPSVADRSLMPPWQEPNAASRPSSRHPNRVVPSRDYSSVVPDTRHTPSGAGQNRAPPILLLALLGGACSAETRESPPCWRRRRLLALHRQPAGARSRRPPHRPHRRGRPR